MRYKAKDDLKKIGHKDLKLLSPQQHRVLMSGEWVEFEPTKELMEYLEAEYVFKSEPELSYEDFKQLIFDQWMVDDKGECHPYEVRPMIDYQNYRHPWQYNDSLWRADFQFRDYGNQWKYWDEYLDHLPAYKKNHPFRFIAWAKAYPDEKDPFLHSIPDSVDAKSFAKVWGIWKFIEDEELFYIKEMMLDRVFPKHVFLNRVDLEELESKGVDLPNGHPIYNSIRVYTKRNAMPFVSVFNKSLLEMIKKLNESDIEDSGLSEWEIGIKRLTEWFYTQNIDHKNVKTFWSAYDLDEAYRLDKRGNYIPKMEKIIPFTGELNNGVAEEFHGKLNNTWSGPKDSFEGTPFFNNYEAKWENVELLIAPTQWSDCEFSMLVKHDSLPKKGVRLRMDCNRKTQNILLSLALREDQEYLNSQTIEKYGLIEKHRDFQKPNSSFFNNIDNNDIHELRKWLIMTIGLDYDQPISEYSKNHKGWKFIPKITLTEKLFKQLDDLQLIKRL